MSLEFFRDRLPWQPKVPCNFNKIFIDLISTLSSIILCEISYFSQRVHLSEIFHPSQIYPIHLRSVYDLTEAILANLYREVSHMLSAKYQLNWPSGSGEKLV